MIEDMAFYFVEVEQSWGFAMTPLPEQEGQWSRKFCHLKKSGHTSACVEDMPRIWWICQPSMLGVVGVQVRHLVEQFNGNLGVYRSSKQT
jgi:hypothetical protein